ncbi:MAG: transcription antitermination factor NusB [Candidatus Omnitrophota bacterium]|jgi:transcription antitermination factor NusB
MRKRTRAREIALQILYQADIRHEGLNDIAEDFFRICLNGADRPEESVRGFAISLAKGTLDNIKTIDAVISSYAQNWQLERMAVIDRNIMRMACYELLYVNDIPAKVSINEAVDLAKKYGDTESGKFVNGILDKVKKTEVKEK